jgi:hypothetical protein
MYLLFAYPNLYNCQTSLKHTLDVKRKRPVFELKEIQNKYYSSAKVLHNGNHRRLIGFGLNEINCCQEDEDSEFSGDDAIADRQRRLQILQSLVFYLNSGYFVHTR